MKRFGLPNTKDVSKRQMVIVFALLIASIPVSAQRLFVGVNYAPHDDKDTAKIRSEIAMMKDAGFNMVRVGHLAWDSYEIQDGVYDFEWFDYVMNRLNDAGIKVLLDIPIRPAPLWLHKKYPNIDITDANGNRLYPNHRYMEDMGDPDYQRHALRFAEVMVKRYAKHPALMAFGVDNESGDGMISYSESALQRFRTFLKEKYTTAENLNKAWAGQRWSRRINDFDEVGFPMSGTVKGAPERMLDFKRFVSSEINRLLIEVLKIVEKYGEDAETTTNAWYYSKRKYFDYAPVAYSGLMTREGCGFYPGGSLTDTSGLQRALFEITRIQHEATTPFWCTEFVSMQSVPGVARRSAYATLMYGGQMACAWLWQSMHNGEEQYLEGMVDWDGIPNRAYDEYKQIASEFKKIEQFFPYQPKPEIGIAYTHDSQVHSAAYADAHDAQAKTCFDLCFDKNLDVAWLDPSYSSLNYKILFVPGMCVIDSVIAQKIRRYVEHGGVVVMTANSAVTDSNGRIFDTTRPGLLPDVFGIRIAHFEQTKFLNELPGEHLKGTKIKVKMEDDIINTQSERIDVVEPRGAEVLATTVGLNKDYPVVTCNNYGKGKAIYVGIPARAEMLKPLFGELLIEQDITMAPSVPEGVMARKIDDKHILYLNLTGKEVTIETVEVSRSLIYDKVHGKSFKIPAYEPEFIELVR